MIECCELIWHSNKNMYHPKVPPIASLNSFLLLHRHPPPSSPFFSSSTMVHVKLHPFHQVPLTCAIYSPIPMRKCRHTNSKLCASIVITIIPAAYIMRSASSCLQGKWTRHLDLWKPFLHCRRGGSTKGGASAPSRFAVVDSVNCGGLCFR